MQCLSAVAQRCRSIDTIRVLPLLNSFHNVRQRLAGERSIHTEILEIDTPIIPLSEVRRFIIDCMVALETPEDFAETLAENLVEADYRGHYSHGLNRLWLYIQDVENGTCNHKETPCVLKETAATAWVDGKNGLGAVVGKFSMDIAIKKAQEVGVGWVAAKGMPEETNHYGIAGMYSLQAMKYGLIGMSFTNTSPVMVPTRAKQAALGTNPLAIGAPSGENDNFLLDMATTAVALGKIEIQMRKNEPIPDGWALDEDGNTTTDPRVAYKASRMLPLGGSEHTSGYKGYGLGLLVDVLTGVLAGGSYGPLVRKWGDPGGKRANLGQGFVALDPKCFAPGFEVRLCHLLGSLRSMEPKKSMEPIMTAGEPERLHMRSVDSSGGVRYVPNQLKTCRKLSEKFNIKPLQVR